MNVQYKAYVQPRGVKEKQPGDAPRVAKLLRDAHYSGWVVLEYELKEDPWQKVPTILADMRPQMG